MHFAGAEPRILSDEAAGGQRIVRLTADAALHGVHIDVEREMSDNYFDLLPGQIKTVTLAGEEPCPAWRGAMRRVQDDNDRKGRDKPMRSGICVAGNLIVDITFPIDGWPGRGEVVRIRDGITRSVGGAVCNVSVDLSKLDPALKIFAVGKIGKDSEGDLIMKALGRHPGIDTSGIVREGSTSFCNVMSETDGKQRTFFTYMGANSHFCEADIRWDTLSADIFHIGYVLLLDALDEPDSEYGSKMARLLHTAQEKGMRTSVDVVSEASDRFSRLRPAPMKYADYCIINEYEAQKTTGIVLRDENGELVWDHMPAALKRMKEMGVSTWAVIHCPEGGFGFDEDDVYVARPSLKLPEGFIRGAVGAGDAFCAGVLYGVEKGFALDHAIDLANCAAAASLREAGATEGMAPLEEVLRLGERYGRQ